MARSRKSKKSTDKSEEGAEIADKVEDTVSETVEPSSDADSIDAEDASDLFLGRMAEFNRIFLQDCLEEFCDASGNIYRDLVADNSGHALPM